MSETASGYPESSKYPSPLSSLDLLKSDHQPASYLIDRYILENNVNLLYGDGGTGKTLLSLHLAVAIASGTPFFGLEVCQRPALVVLAEDSLGETKARLIEICRSLGVDMAALPLRVWSLQGHDLTLASITDAGEAKSGPFTEALEKELLNIGQPCFLLLDTVADFANLDENKRLPVNTLCKTVFGGLCRKFDATVLVTAHPSKAAMSDASQYSGSTAWNNAVRSRLSLVRSGKGGAGRTLKIEKANYGQGGEMKLFLTGKTFSVGQPHGHSDQELREQVYEVVVDMIDRGINVVQSNGAGQKPRDVATEIMERFGITLEAKEVLGHLQALVRDNRLSYSAGGNSRRGQRAGYHRYREIPS